MNAKFSIASEGEFQSGPHAPSQQTSVVANGATGYTSSWHSGPISEIALRNGFRIRYIKTGSGPNLLLLHTLRTQLDYFQKLIPLLRDHYTIYAIDLPGHGWSSIERDKDYDEPLFRQSIIEFIEQIGLTDLIIGGDSIGGSLSLTVAAKLGDRVNRAVAINPYDYSGGVRRANLLANVILGSYQLPLIGGVFANLENRPVLGAIIRGGFYDGGKLPKDLLEEFRRVGRRSGYPRMVRSLMGSLGSFINARKMYGDVRVPATLVYGEHDWSKPAEREANDGIFGHADTIILRNTGHFASLERPQDIAQLLTGR